MISDYKTAKENFMTLHLDGCREFFAQNSYALEEAYCCILDDNLERASELFKKNINSDIRAHWGVYLVSMLKLNAQICPSYFELRNFLEIDLNILIQNAKGKYVQNVLAYTEYMSKINPEIYKFIGRVFYNNGLRDEGMYLFEMAKDAFYQDPELHYLLACAYLDRNDKKMALHYAKTCQEVLPKYFPAVSLEKKIQSVALN